MEHNLRYKLEKNNNQTDEYTIVLYLADHLSEFADELGTIPRERKDIITLAKQIVKINYPNLKVKMVRVIIGGIAVTSLPLVSDNSPKAHASEQISSNSHITQDGSIYYQVGPGDTLWNVSQKYNTTVDHIKRANNLTSDILRLNQQLIIPITFHTVATGDYLTVLAKKYGTTVDAIRVANGLTSDSTRLGQILTIPMVMGAQVSLPTAPVTPAVPTNENQTTYTAVAGDTLSGIASRFGITTDALRSTNQLTSDLLRVGQTLTIPKNEVATPEPERAPSPVLTASAYTVVLGDTLSGIASRFGTTVDALRSTNQLTSDLLRVGQTLAIPKNEVATPEPERAPSPVLTASAYTVVAGDTLSGIASRFGTTVDALRSTNQLTSDLLRVGQILTIPKNGVATTEPEKSTSPTPITVSSYTVISGDNLSTIAKRFGTTVEALRSTNNLTTDLLSIGQVLTIPNGTAAIQPSPAQQQTPAPSESEQTRTTFTYSVRFGDNLSVIANRFGVTADSIRLANNLKSDVLQVGQALKIQNGLNAPTTTSENTITYKTHTVVSGDNIWDLSVRYGIPQSELLKVNNLTTNSRLSIGQKLTIPVHNIGVKEVVSAKHGEYLNWFSEAQYVFPIGKTAKVTDLSTGKSFKIKRTIGSGHADCETLTVTDSNIAKSVWGGYSWVPRAVILEVDGRKLAASMTFFPHEREYISGNGITGHFDVYFGDSIRHKDGLPDRSHQAQVERAAGLR